VHAGEITLMRDAQGAPVSVSGSRIAPRPILRSDAVHDRNAFREEAAYAQIVALLERLGAERLRGLLEVVAERATTTQPA
jgi:hypothetical protein